MKKKKHHQGPRWKQRVYTETKDGFIINGKRVIVEKKRSQSKERAASSPAR